MTEKDLELFNMDQGKNEWVRRSRMKYESALNVRTLPPCMRQAQHEADGLAKNP